MKYSLSLTFAALAAVSIAGCASAPTKPNEYTVARASGGSDCQRIAQPGDTKIQIYCQQSRSIWPVATPSESARASGYSSCRRLARSAFGPLQTYCGTTAQWSEFDTLAIKTGVTCRWLGHPAREVCLDGNQWVRAEANSRGRTPFRDHSFFGYSSGSTGWTSPSDGAGSQPYATSYGYFPAGGAIGQ
jgi:hypothetical protein